MAVSATDIEYRLSGGAANASPDASLGGVMSATPIADSTNDNLFDDVSQSESTSGDTEYRCFYITNKNATDTLSDCGVYISAQTPSADTSVEIGLDPAGVGDGAATGVATTIADEQTAPTGVTFSAAPVDAATALAVGNLGPGQAIAVWIKRAVTAGAAGFAADGCGVTLRGTPI